MADMAFPTWIIPPPGLLLLKIEQMTTFTSAISLPTAPSNAVLAFLQPENGNLRWRADGTDPTGDIGMVIWGTSTQPVAESIFTHMRLINMTGSTCKMDIAWFGGV